MVSGKVLQIKPIKRDFQQQQHQQNFIYPLCIVSTDILTVTLLTGMCHVRSKFIWSGGSARARYEYRDNVRVYNRLQLKVCASVLSIARCVISTRKTTFKRKKKKKNHVVLFNNTININERTWAHFNLYLIILKLLLWNLTQSPNLSILFRRHCFK